jgi:CopG family nickel-responsive transcriptional regulator
MICVTNDDKKLYGSLYKLIQEAKIMAKIVRVGVTFPPDLLKDFDEAIGKMRYDNRSKAIQDSVRNFVSEYKWLREQKGVKVGVLVMVYDYEARGLETVLTGIQHRYSRIISSSMHIHLSERDCLETIALRGEAEQIRNLAEELSKKKGVKQTRLIIVSQ